MEEREFSLIGHGIAVDLSNCAQEPIHIPGRIQPHGILLAIKEPDLTILQVSDNIFELLGVPAEELLNQPLEKLLGPSQLAAVRENIRNQSLDANPLFIFTLKSPNEQHVFDGIIHRMDGLLILELEQFRASPENRQQNVYNVVKTSLTNIQNS
ncbi:MAG TPA: hypothetical protein VFN23_01590, partial [Ktedonobacteraceae bacterium]|nr:hypothetical protein [Ktedonobacteraceae bacterium]